MTSLDRNDDVACDNFGTKTSRSKIGRDTRRCSNGTFDLQWSNFTTISQVDLNNHCAAKPKVDSIVNKMAKSFPVSTHCVKSEVCAINRSTQRFFKLHHGQNTSTRKVFNTQNIHVSVTLLLQSFQLRRSVCSSIQ